MSRFHKIMHYLDALDKATSSWPFGEKAKLKKLITEYKELYQALLDRYIQDFLKHSEVELKKSLGITDFDIHSSPASTPKKNIPITTASEATAKNGELYQLKKKIESEEIADKQKVALYHSVCELILDDYFFNPAHMSNTEKAWMALKTSSMAIAALSAFGALICTILTPFFPPAALPALILGKIALVGLIPIAIDVKDYIVGKLNHRSASSRTQDVVLNIVIPTLVLAVLLPTLVVTSPLTVPIFAGLKALEIFGLIGGYGLNSVATVLNAAFLYLNAKAMRQRATTPQTKAQLKNHTEVDAAVALRVLSADQPLSEQLTAKSIKVETPTLESAPAKKQTASSLYFLYQKQDADEYPAVASYRDDIAGCLGGFTWPVKSLLFKKVEIAEYDYRHCSADESQKSRQAKIATLIKACNAWEEANSTKAKPSLRTAQVVKMRKFAEQEQEQLELMTGQNLTLVRKAAPSA